MQKLTTIMLRHYRHSHVAEINGRNNVFVVRHCFLTTKESTNINEMSKLLTSDSANVHTGPSHVVEIISPVPAIRLEALNILY